jgi:hypothetical protein
MVDDLWDVLLPIISRDATTLKSLHEKGLVPARLLLPASTA